MPAALLTREEVIDRLLGVFRRSSFQGASLSELSKATGLGKFFPFYVTSNEVRCSEDIPQQYHVYRVFNFGRSPRLYILHGALRDVCRLEPVLYRAAI